MAGLFNPKNFTSGNLVDDVDVTIVGASFEMFDYGGKSDSGPAPALKLDFQIDGDPEVKDQYYSCGRATDWAPSSDGKKLTKVGSVDNINSSSNFAQFLTHLVMAGYPEDILNNEEDISKILVGLKAHLKRIAIERKGINNQDGSTKKSTVLVVEKIIALPGENKGAATQQASGGTANQTQASSGESLEDEATSIMLELLANGPVAKGKIVTTLNIKLAGNPRKGPLLNKCFSDEFLRNGPWTFDEATKTVSLG